MRIIGIDLGTTNSLVSYFSEEGAVLIPNSFAEFLTPSVVGIGEGDEVFVGKIAKERLITSPEKTVSVFKRSMGSKKEYLLGKKTFLPEELSSFIIKKLKEDAEAHLGESVEEAIISVPAYFNDTQRRATKIAGELAGLRVERIISEPTAAAIAYGLHEDMNASKHLIFDLGGGTFDVSILEFNQSIMEVRAVAGDNFLGGEDFTEILIDMFLKHHNIEEQSLSVGEAAMLIKSAEKAKIDFSSANEVVMEFPKDAETLTFSVTLDDYERKCEALLNRLKTPIIRALTDASIKITDIQNVILVGGATKLSIIRRFVGKLFGKFPAYTINPDEVVALGVGVATGMKARNEMVRELILTDVCPFTLGTETSVELMPGLYQNGNYLPIIERNTTIPASRVERVFTLYDNQLSMRIGVYQGEHRKTKDNIFLGEFTIPIPPNKAGQEGVDIRYTYNINGILEVEATVISTELKKRLVLEKNPGTMSEKEIEESLKQLESLKLHPRENDQNKFLLEKGERLYQEAIGYRRIEIANELRKFEAALDKQDPSGIEKAAQELAQFFEDFEASPEY